MAIAPFPSFGLGVPLHPIQPPTPSGPRPPQSGCHLVTAHGAGSRAHPITGALPPGAGQDLCKALAYKLFAEINLEKDERFIFFASLVSLMPEAIYFKGKVVVGKRIGDKVYARIDVYIDEGGKELAKYIGKEVAGIAVVVVSEGSEGS